VKRCVVRCRPPSIRSCSTRSWALPQNNDIAFSVLQEVVADFLCTRFKHPYGVALNFGDELGVRIVANEARCAELNAHAVNPERSGK
jgi:hypothetical protein